ncbi:MAG TPA: hypothetical protein VMS12_02775 [Thermoanaerobaculia bacterium]|nr:hypothetical protein [Thermoanaerobaculia bacterium]
MDPRYRIPFNAAFTDALYKAYAKDLQETVGPIPFRLAESPVFLPPDLERQLIEASEAILDQLIDPAALEKMKAAVPPRWDTPGLRGFPSFSQVDFAIVRAEDGALTPRLIELQGFPSLTAFQIVQRDSWARHLTGIEGLSENWSCWFGLTRGEAVELVRRTITGEHDPHEVILMDLDPPSQKTVPDFVATKRLFDVDAVCPTKLVKEGKRLFRQDEKGRKIPIRRIYNRVVFDELFAKKTELPFDYRDELDVEWAPHPNWYWIWSKYSLPFLEHWSVPRATLVSDLQKIPLDLSERYVLKPLFSFAGGGVNIEPAASDIERIPDAERGSWCIQEKIAYEPALEAADGGGVKVEVRMMFLRPDDLERPKLVQNLCRLSRGKMLGVDFNKDFTWVGSSIGLLPEER